MTVSLAALMVGGTLLAMRKPLSQAGSRAVAEQVAEFLRGARQQALAEQVPVAVLLPTDGGSNPCSQSVALARGESAPQITRVLDFAHENPATVLFVGTWNTPSGAWTLTAPDLAETNYWGTGYAPVDAPLARWTQNLRDFVFLFTPRGSVLTNNIPNLNGTYHIVVTQGALTEPGTASGSGLTLAAPPPLQNLKRASDPYTIDISATGAVSVSQGYPGETGPAIQTAAAPRHDVTAPPNDDPTITDIELFPPAGVEAAAQGVSATINRERQMTIRVRATIPSAEDLFCNVTVTGVDAAGNPVVDPGSLSSAGAKRMRYQPELSGPIPLPGHWVTEWQWLPPIGLPGGGDVFTITAQVKSKRSNVVSSLSTPALVKKVKIYDKGRIYFAGVDPYTDKLEIFMVRADGSDLTRVTHEEPSNAQHVPTATRDGNKLLFASVNMTGPNPSSDLFALSRLGGLSTRITGGPTSPDPAGRPSFSDDSTVAVLESYPGGLGALPEFWAFDPNGLWPPPRLKVYDNPPGTGIGVKHPVVSPAPSPGFTSGNPAAYDASDPRRCCWMRYAAFASDYDPVNPATGTATGQQAIYTAHFCLPSAAPADPDTALIPLAQASIRKVSSPGPGQVDETPVFSPDPINRRLAFIRKGATDPGGKVYVTANLNGSGGEFLLTGGLTNCFDPAYNPDGTSLVVAANVSGVYDLYTIPLDPANQFLTAAGPPRALGTPGLLPFTIGFKNLRHPSWSL